MGLNNILGSASIRLRILMIGAEEGMAMGKGVGMGNGRRWEYGYTQSPFKLHSIPRHIGVRARTIVPHLDTDIV